MDAPVPPSMAEERIADDELLYRAIRESDIKRDDDGQMRFGSQSFADRAMQPSVDRAQLLDYTPQRSLDMQPQAVCVVSVVAEDVRQLSPVTALNNNREPVGQPYLVDVKPDPLEANPAHAVIFLTPSGNPKSIFVRLLDRLSRIAQLELMRSGQGN